MKLHSQAILVLFCDQTIICYRAWFHMRLEHKPSNHYNVYVLCSDKVKYDIEKIKNPLLLGFIFYVAADGLFHFYRLCPQITTCRATF